MDPKRVSTDRAFGYRVEVQRVGWRRWVYATYREGRERPIRIGRESSRREAFRDGWFEARLDTICPR